MVRNMVNADAAGRRRASRDNIRGADLEDNDLVDGTYIPVWEQQADRTTTYAGGHGPANRNSGNAGFGDLDIQNGAGNASDGKLRWEVYRDSSKENLKAVSDTFRSEDLRGAASGTDRTEKPVFPQKANVPPQDGYLVLAMDADSGSDGDTVSSANSTQDLGVPYSRIQ